MHFTAKEHLHLEQPMVAIVGREGTLQALQHRAQGPLADEDEHGTGEYPLPQAAPPTFSEQTYTHPPYTWGDQKYRKKL